MARSGDPFDPGLGGTHPGQYKLGVVLLALWRWVLLRLVRIPAVGGLALVLLGGIPLMQSLRPLPTPRGAVDLALSWAYPAALVGIALALALLSQASDFLVRLERGTRSGAEWGGLALAAALLQLPTLGGALLSGAGPADLGTSPLAILLTSLRLASLALVLLALPLTTVARVSLFLGVAWIVPALASGNPFLARLLGWLDARPDLAVATPAGLAPLAPALALVLAARLLRAPPLGGTSG